MCREGPDAIHCLSQLRCGARHGRFRRHAASAGAGSLTSAFTGLLRRFPAGAGEFWNAQCHATNITYFLSDLRSSLTMKEFFRKYSNSYRGEESGQDEAFRFLRGCECGLPQLFSVVELFSRRIVPSTNYGLFIAAMPRWFHSQSAGYTFPRRRSLVRSSKNRIVSSFGSAHGRGFRFLAKRSSRPTSDR